MSETSRTINPPEDFGLTGLLGPMAPGEAAPARRRRDLRQAALREEREAIAAELEECAGISADFAKALFAKYGPEDNHSTRLDGEAKAYAHAARLVRAREKTNG